MSETNKRTAAQRLDDLERGVLESYRVLDNIVRDLATIKDAIKLLGNKTNAIVTVSSRGEALSDASLSAAMIEANVSELESKLAGLIAQGVLKAEEQVGDQSFVVARERDADGNIVNPRLQFALSALPEELRAKIKGSKSGDILMLEENKLKLEIIETYGIQSPTEVSAALKAKAEESVSAPAVTDTSSTTETTERSV